VVGVRRVGALETGSICVHRAHAGRPSQYILATVDLGLLGKGQLLLFLRVAAVPHSNGESKTELKEKRMTLMGGQRLHYISIKEGRDRELEKRPERNPGTHVD
jgi:hypothetical protein